MRELLAEILDKNNSRLGHVVNWSIQVLIILSIICFSLETVPRLSNSVAQVLSTAEIVFTIIFTMEYLLRVWAAKNRSAYIFSFFGLIDLLAIAPFFVGLIIFSGGGLTLGAVRVFRLMRMFRLLKLARYNVAMRRFQRAFASIREELILTGTVTACVIFFAAVMIYYFERDDQPETFASVFHALWWSVVTLTTVGYGDSYPVTAGGRFFTGLLLIAGLGLVSVPSGLIASALTATRKVEEDAEH